MEIKNFLEKFYDFGIDKKYFIENELGKLDKSCCNQSKIKVIDFDETKKIMFKGQNIQPYKSSDALYFDIKNEKLIFIEMKGLLKFIKHQLNANDDIKKQTIDKIKDFNLEQKIEDSLILIQHLLRFQNFELKNKISNLKNCNFEYVFLTDIEESKNPREFLALAFEYKSQFSNPEKFIYSTFKDEIDNLNIPNTYKINKPRLLNCNEFEIEFSKIN